WPQESRSFLPLTRAPITPSMIVKPEECKYDPARGSFIIKDS
ncbi:TPA: T3SS effector NleG family protein, partial [Escherichia coli]